MTDNPRLRQLLDELHDSHATPEEVCRSCPELLPEVRARWRAVCRVRAELDALFPPPLEGDASTPELQEGATGCSSTNLAGMRRSPSMPPQEGSALPQIPGYEVQAALGQGGMGIVFRAKHLRLNRIVALKMVLAGASAGPRERARFQREAEAVAGLRHPSVVQIYDVGDVDGRPYFTMELVEGSTLAQKLAGTPQDVRHAAELAATLARAVQAAHTSGIIHRDLKPSNVLLTAEGTPKITDFGLARRLDDGTGLTQTGLAVGTPSYMAPEQAGGRPDAVGPAVDVYALGAILYELLTGRPPFKGQTAAETVHQVIYQEPVAPTLLNPKVPRDLETICLKCLQKEPQRRYGTAAALAEDLSRFLRGEPILARRAGPFERLVKWTSRHRSLAASIVAGMLLVNVLLGVGAWVMLERSATKRLVNEDFDQVVAAERVKQWDQAHAALERAKARLGGSGPQALRLRAAQLERELVLAAKLEDILLDTDGSVPAPQPNGPRYEEALREAGLVDGAEEPAVVAARIRAAGVATTVLAALDDWASWASWASWHDDGRRNWLFEVARLVDEDPASRPIRDARLWENRAALDEFARWAPLGNQSVPLLHFLGLELHRRGGDAIAYYKRVQQAHATNCLANAALGYLLANKGDYVECVRYFQAAIALRPTLHRLRHNFGSVLFRLGKTDEAMAEFEEARRLAPDVLLYHESIGRALLLTKRPAEAERQFRKLLETEPNNADYLNDLAFSLSKQNRHAEAIDLLRQAIASNPNYLYDLALSLSKQNRHAEAIDLLWHAIASNPNSANAHRQMKENLLFLHNWKEGRDAWQKWLTFNPPDHEAWDGYAELCLYLRNEPEYRRARTELLSRFGKSTDPRVAERTGRACLFLPASEDELRQATNLIDRALASERAKPSWLLSYFRFAKALAEYRAGRLESALALLDGDTLRILGPAPRLLLAMVQHRLGKADAARKTFEMAIAAFDWDPAKATNREVWVYHLLRREAETLLASKP
jgi:eukaryotic-like serine/threonine-protein kinase